MQRASTASPPHDEHSLRQAIEATIPAGIAVCDVEGRQTYVNPAFCEMVGWPARQLAGAMPPFVYWPEDQYEAIEAAFTRTLNGDATPHGFELRFQRRNGEPFDVLVAISPLLSGQGEPEGWLASVTDITEQKKTQKALQQNEHHLRFLLDAVNVGTWDWDMQTGEVMWSPNLERIHGREPGSFTGSFESVLMDVLPEDRELLEQAIQQTIAQGSDYHVQYRIRTAEGKIRWVEGRGQVHYDDEGSAVRMGGICTDITEKREAEAALRESEERFRQLAETIDEVFYITEPEGVHYVSPAFERIWQSTRQELYDDPTAFLRVVHPDDRERVFASLDRQMAGNSTEEEYTLLLPDGTERWIRDRAFPVLDDDGNVFRVVGIAEDLTSRKRAEMKARRFKFISDHANDAYFLSNAAGYIRYVNRVACKQLRYTEDELLRSHIADVNPTFNIETYRSRFETAAQKPPPPFESTHRRKDGTTFPIEISLTSVELDGTPFLFAAVRDITERKQSDKITQTLADAGLVLAESLDYETTLEKIADLMVPTLADWCSIDLVEPDGSLQQVAVRHIDPARIELARRLRRRYPPSPDAPRGLHHVVHTGRSDFYAEITDEMLEHVAQNEEHLQILRELKLRSSMVVPLVARGHTLGTISLTYAESNRRYRERDLAPIEDLARSCALAVDNARLYREAQRELDERRRAEQEIGRLNRDLQRRVDELQTLFDVTPIGLAVAHDPDCQTITGNPAFAEMLGLAPEASAALRGPEGNKVPFKVYENGREILPDDLPMYVAAARNERVRDRELRIAPAEGQRRILLGYASPLHDENGHVRGSLGAFVDITTIKEVEQALRESENRFRQLANAMPQIVWVRPHGQQISFTNQQWEAYTGLSLEQTMDRQNVRAVIHSDDRDLVFDSWDQAERLERPFEAEYRLRNVADGSYRWFLGRSVPLRDESGNVQEWFGTATDITALKQAETALREQSRTLETINRINTSLAAELNLETLVQAVTDAGTELTGAEFGAFFYKVLDDRGETFMLYSVAGVPREAFERFPMPRNTPTFHGEGVVRLDDVTKDPRYGQNPPYEGMPEGLLPVRSYLAVPVISRAGEELGALFFGHSQAGVFTERAEQLVSGIADQAAIAIENARLYSAAQRELAERKKAESKLKELNDTLEQRVHHRTAELERLNTQLTAEVLERRRAETELERTNTALSQSNRELQDFAYIASHDLQEPLRKIGSFVDLLRSDYDDELDEQGHFYLQRMQDAALRMSTLIHDLLAFSRVKTQGQPFERIDLSEVLRTVLIDLEVALSESEGEIEATPLPPIEADATQMGQLFQNLIGNALKFHREGVPPRVDIVGEVEEEEGRPVLSLRIMDNGIGFEQKYADRIFSPFQRLHGRSTYPGTGMGLAICRRIVERHGGRITVESRPGEGSVFHFILPVAHLHPREEPPQ